MVVNWRRLRLKVYAPLHPVYGWSEDETTTRWNIVNWGTEKLKFQEGSDSLTVLKNNRDSITRFKTTHLHKIEVLDRYGWVSYAL